MVGVSLTIHFMSKIKIWGSIKYLVILSCPQYSQKGALLQSQPIKINLVKA